MAFKYWKWVFVICGIVCQVQGKGTEKSVNCGCATIKLLPQGCKVTACKESYNKTDQAHWCKILGECEVDKKDDFTPKSFIKIKEIKDEPEKVRGFFEAHARKGENFFMKICDNGENKKKWLDSQTQEKGLCYIPDQYR